MVLQMLRVDAEARRVLLILQGHIVAEWADALELECLELSRCAPSIALDLSGVSVIGRSGIEALGRLARAGIEILACSPLIADMLEQEGIAVVRDGQSETPRGS